MSVYLFEPQKERPDRINVYDPTGVLVAWIPMDAAMVVAAMYQTGLKRHGAQQANEFMYGYVLGMTHAMLYADQLPRITVQREGDSIKISATEDGAEIQAPVEIADVKDSAHHADEALGRLGLPPGARKAMADVAALEEAVSPDPDVRAYVKAMQGQMLLAVVRQAPSHRIAVPAAHMDANNGWGLAVHGEGANIILEARKLS